MLVAILSTPAFAQPNSFFGALPTYSPSQAPRWTGQLVFATRILKDQLWSYTSYAVYAQKSKVLTITSTGACTPVKTLGPLTIMGCGTAGTASGASGTTLGLTGGGAALLRLPKGVCSGGCSVVSTMQYVSAGQVQAKAFGLGVGYAW